MGFVRKHLSADGLLNIVKHGISHENFPVCKNSEYSWENCIMSGLAVFGLKQPSLLQFEKVKLSEKMNYIIGVKPGDHTYLFDWMKDLKPITHTKDDEDGTRHEFRYYTNVPLNDANHDYRVNVLEYFETHKSGKQQRFSWALTFRTKTRRIFN